MERERLIEYAHIYSRLKGTNLAKKNLAAIKRLEVRITSEIHELKEGHQLLKRPFILRGNEYLSDLKVERTSANRNINRDYFYLEKAYVNKIDADITRGKSNER